MALDHFAIVSNGVYPTPTPTNAIRSALAVSFGLLNITLPAPPETSTVLNNILNIGKSGIRFIGNLLRIG